MTPLRPATVVTQRTLSSGGQFYPYLIGTLIIPSFSIALASLPPVSILVAWMDFEVSEQFSLLRFQSISWPTSCCLCVTYRMDERVFRYKLNPGSEVGLYYPEYEGEILLKNVRLEVWSIANPCVNTGTIHLQTSVRQSTTEKYASQLYYIEDQAVTTEYDSFGAPPLALPLPNPQAPDNNIWTLSSTSEPSSTGIPVI